MKTSRRKPEERLAALEAATEEQRRIVREKQLREHDAAYKLLHRLARDLEKFVDMLAVDGQELEAVQACEGYIRARMAGMTSTSTDDAPLFDGAEDEEP